MSRHLAKLDSPRVAGYEEVWVAKDPDASDAALTDVLRLAGISAQTGAEHVVNARLARST